MLLILLALVVTASAQEISDKEAACMIVAAMNGKDPYYECRIGIEPDPARVAVTMETVLERLRESETRAEAMPKAEPVTIPRVARVPRGTLTIMACARCKALVGANGQRVTTGAETKVDAGMQEITIVTASGREDRFEVEVGEGARVVFMWSSTLMAPKVVGGEARRIK